MRIEAVSGYGDKSAACFLVETDGHRLLLDLGADTDTSAVPDLNRLGRIDAVVISHGHADHVGGLGDLSAIGNPPIYATDMVRRLGKAPLQAAHPLPLQGQTDILGVTIETGRAGHAPGGVWMRIGGPEGMLYSGDICREIPLFAIDAPPRARFLIVDASYGPYDKPIGPAIDELAAAAHQGPLLLPAPSAGRGLEMAMMLHERGLPISLCPEHLSVARALLDHDGGELVPEARLRLAAMLEHARPLSPETKPAGVMIAANAGASAGLAAKLLPKFIDGDVEIIATGHVPEGSPIAKAIEDGKARMVRWNVHPRLSDLIWFIDCVAPEETLPAFVSADKFPELAVALGSRRLVGPTMGA